MKQLTLLINLIITLFVIAACGSIKEFAYSGINRAKWQKTEQVLKTLGIKQGQHVADIGAGAGYFTFKFAKKVGAGGRVYAVEVDPDMIKILNRKKKERKFGNVDVIKGKFDDSLLPENSLDLIFLCNTFHHIKNRVAYFAKLKGKLKSGGDLVIINLNPEGLIGFFGTHGAKKEAVKTVLEKAGFRLRARKDFLILQDYQVFVPTAR